MATSLAATLPLSADAAAAVGNIEAAAVSLMAAFEQAASAALTTAGEAPVEAAEAKAPV